MSRWLHKKLKLSHHRHSGRVLPHSHTSHGALIIILLATGVMLFLATRSIAATAQTLTESGDINVTGRVPGPPPSEPAVILVPKNGDVFQSSPIDVSGACPAGNNFVEIYKNDILAGVTACADQKFGLSIDLIIGKNTLVAKIKDNLDQYGPDSQPVNVTYQPPSPPVGESPAGGPAHQLIVVPDSNFFGHFARNLFKMYITVRGGQPPYAIQISWGDKRSDIVPRSQEGRFEVSHIYQHGDVYYIKINVTDDAGNKAYAQSGVLMAGPKPPRPAEILSEFSLLGLVWPMYLSALGAASTFWLGEKYQLEKLKIRRKR